MKLAVAMLLAALLSGCGGKVLDAEQAFAEALCVRLAAEPREPHPFFGLIPGETEQQCEAAALQALDALPSFSRECLEEYTHALQTGVAFSAMPKCSLEEP